MRKGPEPGARTQTLVVERASERASTFAATHLEIGAIIGAGASASRPAREEPDLHDGREKLPGAASARAARFIGAGHKSGAKATHESGEYRAAGGQRGKSLASLSIDRIACRSTVAMRTLFGSINWSITCAARSLVRGLRV